MGVLQDIIKEATAKDGDVPRMLRLCLVLGKRLAHDQLTRWVLQELEGYPLDAALPPSRKFACRNRGVFENAGGRVTLDIPLSALPDALQEHYATAEIRDGVGELAHLLAGGEGKATLHIPWPPELAYSHASKLSPNAQCIGAWREISRAELAGMLDQVKTRVLGFALDIEREAVDAGDIAGTDHQLKEERVTQIFNTNITGTVQNLANGSQAVSQTVTTGLAQGDLPALLAALRTQGVPPEDVETLKDAIGEDEASGVSQGMGEAVKKWTGDMVTRAATGAVELGLQKLTDTALPAIRTYLGM